MIRLILLALLPVLLTALPARADVYAEANYLNLFNSLIRFGAIGIQKDEVIDDYLMVAECDLYTKFSTDDFKWQRIRTALRQKIRQEVENYPVAYRFDTKLQLGHYDFNESLYRFTPRTQIQNVSTFSVLGGTRVNCSGKSLKHMPRYFTFILDKPASVDGLPLGQKDAEDLLGRLKKNGNTDLLIYTRINFRLVYVSPLVRLETDEAYHQTEEHFVPWQARMDAHLDSVEFYERDTYGNDSLIYIYRNGEPKPR
jgi:hypothetical protein